MEYIVLHTPRRIKQGGTSSNFVNIEMRWVKSLVKPLSRTESVLVLELDFTNEQIQSKICMAVSYRLQINNFKVVYIRLTPCEGLRITYNCRQK